MVGVVLVVVLGVELGVLERLGGHQTFAVDDVGVVPLVSLSGVDSLGVDGVVGVSAPGVLGRGHHVFSVEGVGTVAGVA